MNNRIFDLPSQLAFAALSGDANPIHVDPLIARRSISGRPIVHGIHLVCWALSQRIETPSRIKELEVRFNSVVGVDEPIRCRVHDGPALKIELLCGDSVVTTIKISLAALNRRAMESGLPDQDPPRLSPYDLGPADIPDAKGTVPLSLCRASLDALLPGLSAKLPLDQIAVLCACTRVVGMICPGLHSLLTHLKLEFRDETHGDRPALEWRVDRFEERFNQAKIALSSETVSGVITAMLRPKPRKQESFERIRNAVAADVFVGQKALVVGGSRGVGEVAAKLVAAGGGHLVLTYHQGREEAEHITAEIASAGGLADCQQLDVLGPIESLSNQLPDGWDPTHIYYFATPPIFVARKGTFAKPLFDRFVSFYVHGFHNLIRAVRVRTKGSLAVLYASSEAVETPPADMGEYAAAKAAGEALCRFLNTTDRALNIRVERLPRMSTDQTASLLPVAEQDPVQVLRGILEEMA